MNSTICLTATLIGFHVVVGGWKNHIFAIRNTKAAINKVSFFRNTLTKECNIVNSTIYLTTTTLFLTRVVVGGWKESPSYYRSRYENCNIPITTLNNHVTTIAPPNDASLRTFFKTIEPFCAVRTKTKF